jgi:hypothetical protein
MAARRGFVFGSAQSREHFLGQSLVVIANYHACHPLPSFIPLIPLFLLAENTRPPRQLNKSYAAWLAELLRAG